MLGEASRHRLSDLPPWTISMRDEIKFLTGELFFCKLLGGMHHELLDKMPSLWLPVKEKRIRGQDCDVSICNNRIVFALSHSDALLAW